MPRKRLGKETKQERDSRRQFKDFIEGYGWVVYDEDPDLGEDFLIKIFRDGVPSGISFQVQLKSTKDINTLQLRDGRIRYRLDVDDLEHWDVEWPPVLLVIWDISSKSGWYIHIAEVIKYLDDNRPNWRNQETTTVYLPYTNALDRKHLRQIDRYFSQKIGPIILEGKDLKFKVEFSFPKDKEGHTKFQELQQFHKSGEPVELDERYIKRLDVPDAVMRVYGKPNKPVYIRMGPTRPKKLFAAQIEFSAPGIGLERLDYVEFFITKSGQEQYTLSNKKQNIPYEIELIVNTINHQLNFSLTINYPNMDAIEAHKALKIQKILASKGAITYRVLGKNLESKIPYDGKPWPPPPKGFPEFIEFIYQIQTKTNTLLRLREDGIFTYDDYKNAREMVSILESGTYKSSGLIAKIAIDKKAVILLQDVRSKSERIELKTIADDSCLDILGTHYDLGRMIQYIKGYLDMPIDEINQWLLSADEDEYFEINLRDVELFEEFPNWVKD